MWDQGVVGVHGGLLGVGVCIKTVRGHAIINIRHSILFPSSVSTATVNSNFHLVFLIDVGYLKILRRSI